MLARPLRFGISKAETQRLWDLIDPMITEETSKPLFAREPTGHYYEPLAYAISQTYGQERVYLIQAGDVARRCKTWNQGGFKNDEVDACIIAELFRMGDGRPYQPLQGAYLDLYHLERYRWAQEQASTRLKNQIIGHVDRLYPGLVVKNKKMAERYPPLFCCLWTSPTPRRLLELFPDPYTLQDQTAETLFEAFRVRKYWTTRPYGAKILSAVQALWLPDPRLAAIRSTLLSQDLKRLNDCNYYYNLDFGQRRSDLLIPP